MHVLFLCTGNAARSVMGAVALSARHPELDVSSAGTLVVEGQPISWRTRKALEAVGLPAPNHRSRQADAEILHAADLVVTFEPHHLDWVRREVPSVAYKTASLPRLARYLPLLDAGSPIDDRLRPLALDTVVHEAWEEVIDPGGGDLDVFAACARQIVGHVDELSTRLRV